MARRLPPLNALRAFEAAARHGRMMLAAEELAVTHGAVSRQVRHLEEVLGVKLFEGPKSAPTLTATGRFLAPTLTIALDRIESAVRVIADEHEGVLDVSCLGTFTMKWLIPRLHRFTDARPAIELRLSASDAVVDFDRERYEVAIRTDEHPFPQKSHITSLMAEYAGPVLAPSLAKQLRLKRVTDLARVALLHTKTRRTAWADWAKRSGWEVAGRSETQFEHFYFMLEAATAGLGVGVGPWPLVADDIRAGRLVAPFGFLPSGRTYVAMRRERRSRKAEQFCAWLKKEAQAAAQPTPGRKHDRRQSD